jgi:hypothetical protein
VEVEVQKVLVATTTALAVVLVVTVLQLLVNLLVEVELWNPHFRLSLVHIQ